MAQINFNPDPWETYNHKVEQHENFIERYKFFLDRICTHLDWVDKTKSKTWTTDEIRNLIGSEISRAHSMDAPNKPGYDRANND